MKFGRALREVVRFEILYKLFILCLVNPVMREIYQTYISSVGVSFNAQIVGIFLNLKGAFIFLLLFFTAAFLIFFELSVVVRIVALCRAGAPFRLRTVMKTALWSLGALRGPGVVPAALYYVLFLPVVQTGYINALVPGVTIPEFIFDEMRRTPPLGQIGMVLLYVLLYGAFLALLFVPVRMALQRERFGAAAKSSFACWKRIGLTDALQTVTLRDEYAHPGETAKIPSLEMVLQAAQAAPNDIGLLIELKGDALRQEQLAEAVLRLVERYDFGGRAMFMSLDYYSVMLLHAAHPEWWVGYCVFGSVGDIDDSIWRYNIDFLAVEENMVTNRLVTQAREHGLPTYVWSVNDNEKMLQYMEMGAVGIISDWTDTRAVVDAFNAAHSGVEYAGQDEAPAQDTARLQ